jgi:hypothetical protein
MPKKPLVPTQLYRPSGAMTEEKRTEVKANLLKELAKTDNKTLSCENAGTTKATFYKWVETGFITKAELEEAHNQYLDTIREEVRRRYLHGVRKPLLSSGRLVKDDLDQPIWVEYPSDIMLVKVAEHMLPEWQDGNKPNGNGIPTTTGSDSQYGIYFDAKDLTPEQFQTLKEIAIEVERRKAGIVVVDSD